MIVNLQTSPLLKMVVQSLQTPRPRTIKTDLLEYLKLSLTATMRNLEQQYFSLEETFLHMTPYSQTILHPKAVEQSSHHIQL